MSQRHCIKDCHYPSHCRDIGETLSLQLVKEKLERRQCFLKLMSSIRFLARQALIRGDGDESNCNHMQLLRLQEEDDVRIFDCLN